MRTAAVSSSWPFTTRTWPRPFPARPAPNPGSWRAAVTGCQDWRYMPETTPGHAIAAAGAPRAARVPANRVGRPSLAVGAARVGDDHGERRDEQRDGRHRYGGGA